MDTVIETPYMPKSGETLAGRSVSFIPGGKGANQAYASGKLGGTVSMIGAVSDDSFGSDIGPGSPPAVCRQLPIAVYRKLPKRKPGSHF